MPRLYPALDLVWSTTPSEDRLGQLIANLDDEAPTGIEEHEHSTRMFFSSEERRARAAARLRAEPDVSVEAVNVSDEDWAARSQASLGAVQIGRIVVAPPWVERPPRFDGVWIVIQPSMGFGTGHHASTRLCLALLQAARVKGAAVLDAGTGSSVLAIAAARLGAARVLAIDTDPDALAAARDNVDLNGVGGIVRLEQMDLSAVPRAGSELQVSRPGPQTVFDLVLGNLTGAALVRHARELSTRLTLGGSLIASGFGVGEEDEVAAAFAGAGMLSGSRAEEDGWVALMFTSPTPSTRR